MQRDKTSALGTQHSALLLIVLLASAAIQFHALAQNARFWPDEALFSTFARHAALNGDWLLHGDLDKTPLSIYASALSMHFVAARAENGVLNFAPETGEFAARLPGALASVVLVAAVYALARRLYGSPALAAWAAGFAACSPYFAVYGASAYTDSLMLAFAALAALAAARGRWLWGGVWMALAFAGKQQALYALPLALALGWARNRVGVRQLIAFALPQVAGAALLVAWDGLRAQPTSLWALAAANNNPARLIRSDEVLPRLITWLNYGRTLVGTPTIILSAGALVMIGTGMRRAARWRDVLIDVVLLAYILGYLLVNWLVAFNTYPRYLLPLVVPAALLAARTTLYVWAWLKTRLDEREGLVLAAALALTLFLGARTAGETRAEFSEDGTDYAGITALADFLNAKPLGAVVYDHWLGWELGYYLGEWTDKRRVYYPTPEALVSDALRLDDPAPRYFVAPTREPVAPWLDALRSGGYAVERVYQQQGFAVYELTSAS